MRFKLSSDIKVKLLQAAVYVAGVITLLWFWDLTLFLVALVCGWFFFLIGVHGSLHGYSSHKWFKPRNKVVAVFVLFMGTILSLGSNISWAATHRKHHKHTDKDGDPHSIHLGDKGLWRSLKLYFYYFPTYHISPKEVKDLMDDPIHRWFHKNYYYVILFYVSFLAAIDPVYVAYFYVIPVLYVHTGISYITVTAHSIWIGNLFGYKNFKADDHSFNSRIAALLLPGEGNHHNHHKYPGSVQNKLKPWDIDLGYWYIRLIGKVDSKQKLTPHITATRDIV